MPAPHAPAAPMSVEDVAAVLQVSRYTVIRLADERYTPARLQLRATKTPSGEWQINPSDLAAWINARSVTPHGEQPIRVSAVRQLRMRSLEQVATDTELPLWWLQRATRYDRVHHVKVGKARRMTDAQVDRTVRMRQAGDMSGLRGVAA